MDDEAEQESLFHVEGPDERGSVWICGARSGIARRHNLAPVNEAAEAPSQWLGSMDKSKWREVMVGTVERAYQLAPECSTFDELRARLVKEHCTNVDAHLQGSLRKELSKLLKKKSETD